MRCLHVDRRQRPHWDKRAQRPFVPRGPRLCACKNFHCCGVVVKLTRGQEAYYEQAVAAGLDDYYAGRGDSPGVRCGSGADALGLLGVVGDGDLGRLPSGVDPGSGETLRAPLPERLVAVPTLDPETGLQVID